MVVVGDGPGLSSMKAQADRMGIAQSVEFMGPRSQEDLPALYSNAVLTFDPISMDDIEPYWGGTLQESLACGTPVVAFNNVNPGFRPFGLLVPVSPSGAARLVSAALKDFSWRSGVAMEGPKVIREKCDWKAIAAHLDSTYRNLVGRAD